MNFNFNFKYIFYYLYNKLNLQLVYINNKKIYNFLLFFILKLKNYKFFRNKKFIKKVTFFSFCYVINFLSKKINYILIKFFFTF